MLVISVKEFVGRVEFRRADDENFHFADGSMPYARRNQDRRHRCHSMRLTVQFDRGARIALQYDINFGLIAMVVFGRIATDCGQVNATGKLGVPGKRTSGQAAGAGNRRQSVQVDNDGSGGHCVNLAEMAISSLRGA